ncbi:MAG: elongation factor Ts [Anaerolineae bacterium]|nr:elongation factor Ts [Anaerolineae bacterium]
MTEITTAMVKELREATGAGILESRNALREADGNFDQAVQLLRERGLSKAAKKADRTANQGVIICRIENEATLGAMVELNCETDFVARNERFQELANLVADLVVATGVDTADEVLELKADGRAVKDLITDAVAVIGENIQLRRVSRFEAAPGGFITSYIHAGRIGVLVEITGADETLAHDLALQIAASNPRYLVTDEVPEAMLEAERHIYWAQLADDPKPDTVKARIVDGRVDKYLEEIVLLRQPYIKDLGKSIEQVLKEAGGNVAVRRFARFELGA